MELWQVILIAFIGLLGSRYCAWFFGGLGGVYTLGQPLVGGLIIGAILGDIPTGVKLGAALQAVFLGVMAVGGVQPRDQNLATYIGIPWAMVTGSSVELVLALSVPLSVLGVLSLNLTKVANTYVNHIQDRLIEKGKLDAAVKVPVWGSITTVVFRFVPLLVALLIPTDVLENLVNSIPPWLDASLSIFSGIIPAIGIVMILSYIAKSNFDLIYFLFGFALIAAFGVNTLTVLIVGLVFAYISSRFFKPEEGRGEL